MAEKGAGIGKKQTIFPHRHTLRGFVPEGRVWRSAHYGIARFRRRDSTPTWNIADTRSTLGWTMHVDYISHCLLPSLAHIASGTGAIAAEMKHTRGEARYGGHTTT